MVSFRLLHSHLKLLSNNDLKGTRTECGFKRAFTTLFRQDVQIVTGTMFLNVDQLEKQIDKEEFQKIGSTAAFRVLETQFQKFIKPHISLDDEDVIMTRKYFLEYTQLEVQQFRDTRIQHIKYVKKSIDKRALHKRVYDSRVNEKQMKTTKEKVDSSKALDASLVETESSGKESGEHDTNNTSGNDAHVDDADIRPIYDEEPIAKVPMTADNNVFATGQQHTEQPEFNNEGEVDQDAKQSHDIRPLPTKLTRNQTTELSYQSLKFENTCLKTTVAKFQKDLSKLEAHCINLELQLQNNVLKSGQQGQFLKEKSNEAKVKLDIDIIETINIELNIRTKFSIKKTSNVHEETMTPRSCLRWKPTGRIFKTVGLRWVPIGKIFTSSTTKVDSEPSNGSNEDITNPYECEQTLNVSADTLNLSAELAIQDHRNEQSSLKRVPNVVPPADKTATSQQELELLFSPMYEEYFNEGNQSVSESSALFL
ncbi:hypothetical protein Tco_1045429 [Tanacetum coccineum]|uniref:Uncharacterized protein n=1 Tax=Tanacetum coccineum TaxID=301880 RepID=A0ABQ5GTS1_9ASTR